VFVWDVNLPEHLAEKYTPGLIIREPDMIDASHRIWGLPHSRSGNEGFRLAIFLE
jgi:hypothetical protein